MATSNTRPNKRRTVTPENLRAPKYAPPKAASIPAGSSVRPRLFSRKLPPNTRPTSPLAELMKMNTEATAEASLLVPQRMSRIRGERKIPPPMPTMPESNPMTAPTPIPTGGDNSLRGARSSPGLEKNSIRTITKVNTP
jgi:hypothetical protein